MRPRGMRPSRYARKWTGPVVRRTGREGEIESTCGSRFPPAPAFLTFPAGAPRDQGARAAAVAREP
jgi:hypothetical protein